MLLKKIYYDGVPPKLSVSSNKKGYVDSKVRLKIPYEKLRMDNEKKYNC